MARPALTFSNTLSMGMVSSATTRWVTHEPRSCPHRKKSSKSSYQLDLLLGQGALGIADTFFARWRLIRISMTLQIRGHDSEFLGELPRDLVPHHMIFRLTVEQREQWSVSTFGK